MAVQSLIQAISDKDAVFYIKEKNQASIKEVCDARVRVMVRFSMVRLLLTSLLTPQNGKLWLGTM